jgi:NAD(P)-dependent dehydrogenase (short-subunit alcohol dehydrogenase family)
MSATALEGTVAIVTGGGSGIGKAIARGLAEAGAIVTIIGRDGSRLQKAASDIGGQVASAVGDVTDEADVRRIFGDVLERHDGRIDLVVNSAGAFDGAPFDRLELDAWRRVMDVNVTGAFLCAREGFRAMKASGRPGRIINIGSVSGSRPRHDSSAYTTSKHALWGLTQSIALDGREHGITASCLNPGNTAVERRAHGHAAAGRDEGVEPLMEVEDVARLAVLMASVPPDVNVLEATILPIRQAYLGRG